MSVPGATRVDLTIANLFNARQIVFNGIPIGERTWMLGWTHRD